MSRPHSLLASAVVLLTIHLATSGVAGSQGGGAKTSVKPVPSTPKSIAAEATVPHPLPHVPRQRCQGQRTGGASRLEAGGSDRRHVEHGSTDAEIFEVIRAGVGPKFDMKGFRSRLTTEEMWSLVHYLRSIGPQAAR